MSEVLTIAKDIANIAFYAIVATVTVLTYRRAKRTILQPLRTEIFKQQLGLFSSVLEVFVAKTEFELRGAFGLDALVEANCFYQLDQYSAARFEKLQDEKVRPYNRTACKLSRFYLGTDVVDAIQLSHERTEFAVRPTEWEKRVVVEVRIPNAFMEAEGTIERFLHSPLTPSVLATLLRQYLDCMNANIDATRDVLTQYSREFPQRFPTPESMMGVDVALAVWNPLNHRFSKVEPVAHAIVDYIRHYFEVDKLMDA